MYLFNVINFILRLVCSWLVYDSTDFVAKSKKEVGILSGDKVCGSLSDVRVCFACILQFDCLICSKMRKVVSVWQSFITAVGNCQS